MAASPTASLDESFVSFSPRESTPPPVVKSAGFVPIELPSTDGFSLSAPTAMSDPVAGVSASAAGRSEMTPNNTDHATVTSTVGSHAPMVGASISSPLITWSTGSDGMSFSFNGLTTTTSTTTLSTAAVTSPSESSYVSTSGFSSGADDSDEHKIKTKPKRRRIITKDQRRAANQRERRRMVTLNDAFDMLKQRIPTFSHEKKLSRIETLRLAISYISFMAQLVDGKHPSDVTIDLPYVKQDDQSMQAGLHDVIDNYNYVMQTALGAEQQMPSMDHNAYVMDMNQHAPGYYPNGTFLTQ